MIAESKMASNQQQRKKSLIQGCCKHCYQGHSTVRNSLMNACKTGHVACLKACLRAGANINCRYPGGSHVCRPLESAIIHNNGDCVEALIEEGAWISTEILIAAGEKGNERCVNIILEAGGSCGKILCVAAYHGRCNIVDLLIEAGADVNKYGALVFAAASDSMKCVNRLLQAGADVNGISELPYFSCLSGWKTALLAATEKNSLEIVEMLIKGGADVNMKSDYGLAALHGAARSGSKEGIVLLLKAGVDVNLKDSWGSTALSYRVRRNSVKCIDLLLKAGADLNIRDTKGQTALFDAVHNESVGCIDLLLKAGADVNIRDDKGRTALFDGVCNGSGECIDLLLKAGVDRNIRDRYGRTALFGGVCYGSVECIDLLLKAGADVNVTDDECNTVLLQAMNSLRGIKKVLQEGVKVNIRNNSGLNALTRLLYICTHTWRIPVEPDKELVMMHFAAGETVDVAMIEMLPDYLKPPLDISLMNICRTSIRNHLMQLSDVNLFFTVPRLPLPHLMTSYLLYDVTLDDGEEG